MIFKSPIKSLVSAVAVCLFSFGLSALTSTSQGTAQAQVPSYNPTVGEAHPDFYLPTIEDGTPLKLSDYRGKKVLLMHFASW